MSGVIVVTGASRGIGAAVARAAATRYATVIVNYDSDAAGAEETVRAVEANGGNALAVRANVSLDAEVVELFARAGERGPLTALVNNAGITGGSARVEDVTAETLQAVFAVNVTGAFLCAREAVRRMAQSRGGTGGAIVTIGSIAARIGGGGEWVHYAASKGALHTFTIGLATEVARDGIRVNAVAPGLIETGIHFTSAMPNRLATLSRAVPMQRSGEPSEVAEAVLWLLSPAASYVTGAILDVGGGR